MKQLSMPKLEISLLLPRLSEDITAFHLVFPIGLHPIEGRDMSCPPLGPQSLAQGFHELHVEVMIAKE